MLCFRLIPHTAPLGSGTSSSGAVWDYAPLLKTE
jgi:hypothetical protein